LSFKRFIEPVIRLKVFPLYYFVPPKVKEETFLRPVVQATIPG
jgi:hypothetical protein